MEQHILELIKSNNRIIIPGFGAFLIAREKGYTVLFNNFLNFNDGLLAEYVAKKESVTTEQANALIEQYVARIKETLLTMGTYSIPQLGTFTSDANGNFHFEQNTFLNNEKNGAVVEPSQKLHVKEDEDLLNIDPFATGIPVEEQNNPVSNTKFSSKLMNDPLIELQPSINQKGVKPENHSTSRKKMSNQPKDKNRKNSWLWALIPISLFLIFAGYYFFFRQGETTPVEPPQAPPTMMVDTLIIPDPATEQQTPQPAPTAAPTKAFHIIVGSVKTPALAEEHVKRLQAKGYNNATYFSRDKWYVVSIESLPTMTEAERVQEEILDRDRIESWIVSTK